MSAQRVELRFRIVEAAGGQQRDREDLPVLVRPHPCTRPSPGIRERVGGAAIAPLRARGAQRHPRHSGDKNEKDGEGENERRKNASQRRSIRHTSTLSRRLICKRSAALSSATEISMHPEEPTIRNAPGAAPAYVRSSRSTVMPRASRAKCANGM